MSCGNCKGCANKACGNNPHYFDEREIIRQLTFFLYASRCRPLAVAEEMEADSIIKEAVAYLQAKPKHAPPGEETLRGASAEVYLYDDE